MTILGFCEDDEYLPEYGTVVFRDVYREDGLPSLSTELLGELATNALSGTVATAGDGWLHGTAGDPYQAVRWEAHDEPPDVRLGDWEDIVETPFHSRSGVVSLGTLTGGTFGDELSLGAKGLFRVRVCRKAADGGEEGDVWLIQSWPVPGTPEAPRWLKRTRAAVRSANPGWQQVLGYHVIEVSWFLTLAGMQRPDGWLDEPLPDEPRRSAGVCAQLGVDPPRTRRDAIPLLVAAGLIVDDGAGRFSPGAPRRATEALDLPGELAARVNADAVRSAYIWLAADVTGIAAWSNPARIEDLAALLAVPGETIEPLLEYAAEDKLIRRGNGTVTALPRPPLRTGLVPRVAPRSVRREEPVTVAGAPPRAGFIAADGTVVVWRAGEPVVLGRVDSDYRYRAFETPAGIYVTASAGQGQLMTWAGAGTRLPVDLGFQPVRSADGQHLAGVQMHTGRQPWDQVHFFDVTTEEAWSLPRSENLTRHVLGIHDGAVYFFTRSGGAVFTTSRWVPGREPVDLASPVHRLDPLSGADVREDAQGLAVFTASGERQRTVDTPRGRFVPGGASMYSFQHNPLTLMLLDLTTGTITEHPLPEGCEVGEIPPTAPIWETPDTLVFSQPHHASTRRIIRWHLRREAFEHFDLPEIAGYRPFLIEPMLA
ncbi:hypothetical protein ABZU76_12180 [Amycolatopsis sp. NPDC005232]|uniref:hypothetical protein n=1 Tax=Amycolatopsis sp. NPDC005232 TaxID=3157027 RepID=UPI0033A3F3F8